MNIPTSSKLIKNGQQIIKNKQAMMISLEMITIMSVGVGATGIALYFAVKRI